MLKKLIAAAGILLAASGGAMAQSGQLARGEVWGNFGASAGPSKPTPLMTFPVVNGNLACFNGITGKLQDCGTSPTLVLSFIPAVSIESQGGGCAVSDNTTALNAAVASVAGPVRVLFPQNCSYNFTQANAITFSKQGVYLEGSGQFSAALQYTPAGDGTFLKWSNGLSEMFWGGISNLSVYSADTTHGKSMVEWFDVSTFTVDRVFCAGGTRASVFKLQGGANKSACLYSHGRDDGGITRFQANAEIPIRIGLNPHHYLSADHYRFTDLYLIGDIGSGSNPLIKVDPGVVLTSTTFDGSQLWVGGAHGFDQTDTAAAHFVSAVTAAGSGYTAGTPVTLTGGTCSTPITVLPLTVSGGGITSAAIANPGVCSVTPSNPVSAASGGAAFNLTLVAGFRLAFNNVRTEQGTSSSAYTFNIRPAGAQQGLLISNSAMDDGRCGAFLKSVLFPTIRDSTFLGNGTCKEAVNATAANGNESLRYINNFWNSGVTHNVTGMTKVEGADSPTSTSATVPPSALYSQSVTNHNFNNLTVSLDVAANTYNNVRITHPGSTATITLGSGVTATFPSTDTYVGRSTTDTLTNKTLTSPVIGGTPSGAGASITINGTTCTLAGVCSPSAAASSVAIGTTTIGGGTSGRVLFDNAGVFGEYTAAQLTAQINAATATLPGALPAWPNNTTTFFRGDGSYAAVGVSVLSGAGTGVLASLATANNTVGGYVTYNGIMGAPTIGTVNGNTFTTGTYTLTGGAGKTLTFSNTLTLTGTDGSSVAFGAGGTLLYSGGALGTPSSGTLTNATGLPTTGLTGTLQAAQEPAHTGDVTNTAGSLALAIGATKVTSAMLNADVFSTAHTWAGQQTFVAPILGTPASGVATNLTGLPLSTGITGAGTGVLAALAINVGSAGAFVTNGGALGSPSSAGTIPAFTLGGTISGGGNQINNVIIGNTTPLAGSFTTLAAATSISINNTAATSGLNVLDVAKDWSAAGGTDIMASFTSYGDLGRIVTRRANGTAASPTAVISGDQLGAIQFRGYYVTGGPSFSASNCAGINAIATETFTSTASGTKLNLVSTPSGAGTVCAGGVTGLTIDANSASTSASTGSGVFSGGLGVAGAVWAGTYVATTPTTVGGLTACAAGTQGARMFVTDSNAVSYTAGIGAVVAAGGTTKVPVTCDGTNWRIGANDNIPAHLTRKYA